MGGLQRVCEIFFSKTVFLAVILVFFCSFGLAASLSGTQYSTLNSMLDTHLDYFLSSTVVTSYGLPMTAYKFNDRARYSYSNPTEWGYLLQAYVAAAERGKITKSAAAAKLIVSLDTIKSLQDNSAQNYNRLFYPYYKVANSSGVDVAPYHDADVSIPSIDNALLYMSLIIVDGWARDNNNASVSSKAQAIYSRMNFSGFVYTDASNGKKYAAHVINASTGLRGASKWDVYSDEGGLMAMIAYVSSSVDFNTFKQLINAQYRSSASWNGITTKEAAWFNSMFAWGVRSIAGIPISGSSFSKESFVPATESHLAYGTSIGSYYPGFSDAMTQGFVGYYIPANISGQQSVPAHSTPHAFFIPLNVLADLKQVTLDSLLSKIDDTKNDPAVYYYGAGKTYPFGFVVTTSPQYNKTSYSGVTSDGKNIFETLSHSYIALSTFNALQYTDSKKDFAFFAGAVPGVSTKMQQMMQYLYPQDVIICLSDAQCDDGNLLTIDACVNAGTAQSYCSHTPVAIACYADAECNDNNSQTVDSCVNAGTALSYCSSTPLTPACTSVYTGMEIKSSTSLCKMTFFADTIKIVSDNVVLDCNGALIISSNFYSEYLISVAGRRNVTIKNCNFGHYSSHSRKVLQISNSVGVSVVDNNFNYALESGIVAAASTRLKIKNNLIQSNLYGNGVYFDNVGDSNIENNVIENNGKSGTWYYAGGLQMTNFSYNLRIVGNKINQNIRGLYSLSSSLNNYYAGNSFCYNRLDNSCNDQNGNIGYANTLPGAKSPSCSWMNASALACDQNCTDTDGGRNYSQKGTVSYWDGSTSITSTDYCVGPNGIYEYYCNTDSLYTEGAGSDCSVACVDGACIACLSDSNCNDYNNLTVDTCLNPGTPSSRCVHTPLAVACNSNLDCGTNAWLNIPYCGSSSSVWDIYRTYTCLNAGTANASCVVSDANQSKSVCSAGNICSNGACIVPACSSDSACNDSNALTLDKCNNPGTQGSYCSYTKIVCASNANCNDNNPSTTDTCVNAGTASSYCQFTIVPTKCTTASQCNDNNSLTVDTCKKTSMFSGTCVYTPIICSTSAQCDDGDANTTDTCVNPATTSSYCKHVSNVVTCSNNSQCNDNNPNTEDTCTNPGTTSSKCVFTQIKCFADSNCNDNNPSTIDKCINPGMGASYCSNASPVIWKVIPDDAGTYFNSATCTVSTGNICPPEMGWEGRTVTYVFNIPSNATLSPIVNLKFNVVNRNYGGTKNVSLKISAGSSKSYLTTVVSALDINRLGEFTVPISSSLLKKGATNYIKLYGNNITPTGYGTNPPNFKINSISLSN